MDNVQSILEKYQAPQSQPGVGGNVNNILTKYNQPEQSDPWQGFMQVAAKKAMERGFPPQVILGQAALESARGKSAPGNNFFGIKGSGTAGANNLDTKEYGAGGYYGEKSNFAAYKTAEDSVDAYLNLVTKYPGVPEAIKSGNPLAVLHAIRAAGYATSPTYIQDVASTPEYQGAGQ